MGRNGVMTHHSLLKDEAKPSLTRIQAAITSADEGIHPVAVSEDFHGNHVLNVDICSNVKRQTSIANSESQLHLSSTGSQMMWVREAEAEVAAHMQDELQAIRNDIQNLSSKVRADVRAELERLHSQSARRFDHINELVASAGPPASVGEPPPVKGTEPPQLLFYDADTSAPGSGRASGGYPPSSVKGSSCASLSPASAASASLAASTPISGWANATPGSKATEIPLSPVMPTFTSEGGHARLAATQRAASAMKTKDASACIRQVSVGFDRPFADMEDFDEHDQHRYSSQTTNTMSPRHEGGLPMKSRVIRKTLISDQPKTMIVLAKELTHENTFKGKLLIVFQSAAFDYISAFLVLLNAITIGIQTDYMAKEVTEEVPIAFRMIDVFFCVAFTSELCFRMSAQRCDFFYGDGYKWNLFDLILVVMQLIDEVLSSIAMSLGFNFSFMRVLRILRLIRIIRIIRILRLIGELRTIVSSIMGSLKSLAWTVLLLFLLVYIFGVFFTQLVLDQRVAGLGDTANDVALETYFNSLGRSILSLYQAISGGVDWDDLVTPLMFRVSVMLGFVVSFYIAFALLALLNVVTGVFVEAALKSAKEDRDSYMLHHVRDLFMVADQDGEGTLDWGEFEGQLEAEAMQEFFKSIDVDISEAKAIFHLLDVDDSGRIDLEEFLNGCLGLHGPAQAIHLATLMHETRQLARGYHGHAAKVEVSLASIAKSMSSINESARDMRNSANVAVNTEVERKLSTLIRGMAQQSVDSPAPGIARPLLKRQVALFDDTTPKKAEVQETRQPEAGRNAVHRNSDTDQEPAAPFLRLPVPGCVYGSE